MEMESAFDMLAEDPSGRGLKQLREELFEMRTDVKRAMDVRRDGCCPAGHDRRGCRGESGGACLRYAEPLIRGKPPQTADGRCGRSPQLRSGPAGRSARQQKA